MNSFNVDFLKSRGIQSKKLKGAGVITVSDDEVVLTRSEIPGWFWNTPAETVTVKTDDIANVIYNKVERCVQFSEYRNGVYSGTPFDVYKFTMVIPSEQNALIELLPKLVSEEVASENEFRNKLKQLTPWPFFTILIIAICVGVLIAMTVADGIKALTEPTIITLLRFGADYGPLVSDGEWYRIITSAFVHIGIAHILFNMIILFQVGNFVERLYGNLLFLIVYLGSAVAGSLLSLIANPAVVSAGASGAIFGLYGALLAYMIYRPGAIPVHMVKGIKNGALIFIAINLLWGMQAGIDNWCHFGGLLGGYFLGAVVAPPLESEGRARHCFTMSIWGMAFVVAVPLFFVLIDPIKLDSTDVGNTLAELGIVYHNGKPDLHIKKDVKTAIQYYNRAMKYNNPVAFYNMGVLYRDGEDVEKNEAKALELFKKSAEMGYADAQSEYGRLLYFEKNKKEGLEWLKKACEKESQSARYLMACIYYDGDENVKQNREFALSELKELAEKSYEPAINLLNELEKENASESPNSEDEPVPESESAPEDEPTPETEPVPVENAEPEEN